MSARRVIRTEYKKAIHKTKIQRGALKMEKNRSIMWRSIVVMTLAVAAATAFIFQALVCMIIMKRDD